MKKGCIRVAFGLLVFNVSRRLQHHEAYGLLRPYRLDVER